VQERQVSSKNYLDGKMKIYPAILSITFVILISGCDQTDTSKVTKSIIAKDQIQALEKAKNVEQQILDAAAKNDEVNY
jgi:hypothetical protein